MSNKTRGRGRPPLPPHQRGSSIIQFRMTPAEHDRMKQAAQDEEMTFSEWARCMILLGWAHWIDPEDKDENIIERLASTKPDRP